MERMVLSLCFRLGLRNVDEQLEEFHGRLLEGQTRAWAFLNLQMDWPIPMHLMALYRETGLHFPRMESMSEIA